MKFFLELLVFICCVAGFADDKTLSETMPLNAFGVAVNQNILMQPQFRLNPTQHPQTNNLRLYQIQSWTNGGPDPTLVYTNSDFKRTAVLLGSHYGTAGLTGPGMVYAQDATLSFGGNTCIDEINYGTNTPPTDCTANCNLIASGFIGYNAPTLTGNSAAFAVIFNADEFDASNSEGFLIDDITTTLDDYGMSLNVKYEAREDADPDKPVIGSITDYVVMGSVFHDVFYDGLTPRILFKLELSQVSVDGGAFAPVSDDLEVTGSYFRFTLNTGVAPNIPLQLVLFAENGTGSDITLKLSPTSGPDISRIVATNTYEGWIRAVVIAEGFPNLIEDICSELVGKSGGLSVDVPGTSPIETTNLMLNPTWFTQLQVQIIAQTPMMFYTLFPYSWIADVNRQIMVQNNSDGSATGIEWPGNLNGFRSLSSNAAATSLMLSMLAFDDGSISTGANPSLFFHATSLLGGNSKLGLTTNAAGYGGTLPTAPASFGDSSASLFTNNFLMGFTSGQASTIRAFQDALEFPNGEMLPDYSASNVDFDSMAAILEEFRSAIPTSISEVEFDSLASSIKFKYTLSSTNSGVSQTTAPFICFPAWMYADQTDGESVKDYVIQTYVKGNLFCKGAASGEMTFFERSWTTTSPAVSWIENGDFVPPGTIASLFGVEATPDVTSWLDLLLSEERYSWITDPAAVWPAQTGFNQPLFMDSATLEEGYGSGKIFFQLANTAVLIAEYLDREGRSGEILDDTEAIMGFLKRRLYDFFVYRPLFQNHFTADTTNHGICFNGTTTPSQVTLGGPIVDNHNFVQQTNNAGFLDFGNGLYNDHVLQYGYYMQAVARIIQWDREYSGLATSDQWINQRIIACDRNTYTMRHFIDTIWRSSLNPYIENGGFPFMRVFNLWEGHPEAQGMIYPGPGTDTVTIPSGRNLESIAESFNFLSGVFYYTSEILKAPPVGLSSFYEGVRDAALLLTKFTTSSARVLWFMRDAGYSLNPGDPPVATFMPDFFVNYMLTTGNVNDTGYNSDVAFTSGPQAPTPFPGCPTCP